MSWQSQTCGTLAVFSLAAIGEEVAD